MSMTDTAAAAAPATPPAADSAAPPLTPEAARAQIATRIGDKEFGKKLLASDPAARAEWDALHKAGYPAAPQITSVEDANSQAAARAAELTRSDRSAPRPA